MSNAITLLAWVILAIDVVIIYILVWFINNVTSRQDAISARLNIHFAAIQRLQQRMPTMREDQK